MVIVPFSTIHVGAIKTITNLAHRVHNKKQNLCKKTGALFCSSLNCLLAGDC